MFITALTLPIHPTYTTRSYSGAIGAPASAPNTDLPGKSACSRGVRYYWSTRLSVTAAPHAPFSSGTITGRRNILGKSQASKERRRGHGGAHQNKQTNAVRCLSTTQTYVHTPAPNRVVYPKTKAPSGKQVYQVRNALLGSAQAKASRRGGSTRLDEASPTPVNSDNDAALPC